MTDAKEPSKMVQDEKRPTVEEPAQDAPLTMEQFTAQMQRLTERARDAGLKPLKTMTRTYARRFMGIIEGFLASLESDDSSKKKEK